LPFERPRAFSYRRSVTEVPNEISAATRICAVYGHPIRHSASPAMQNAGIAALGLDWRYIACEVHPDDLRAAIEGARAMKFVGLNLTVPHKLLAHAMVDELDESARTWGAVNTIRFEARDAEGRWVSLARVTGAIEGPVRAHGFNTDADGITRSLREDLQLEPRGASVLLLGAGGAGRVAALKLASEGCARLFLVNRTMTKAEDVAAEIRSRHTRAEVVVGYPDGPIDLVLNATSLGLKHDDPLPFDTAQFKLSSARAAYDMVYRPATTAFLAAAKDAGCRTANGLGMLLYQGAKALEIWSGKPAPVAIMRRALEKNIYGR
jgi:shikimate dehydrogenase